MNISGLGRYWGVEPTSEKGYFIHIYTYCSIINNLFFSMFNHIGFILANWVRGNFEPNKSSLFATNVLAEDRADLIKIEANIEGSNISTVKREKGNQFAITMRPDLPSDYKYPNHTYYWFYFKISGVKNKTITINITNCEWMPNHWDNYKPVYTYSNDPNDLEDHNWNIITNTSRSGKTFTFTHTFAQDSAFIALRYPYNYSRLKKYLLSIEKNIFVSVKALGKTREDREVYALAITDKTVPDSKRKEFGLWQRNTVPSRMELG